MITHYAECARWQVANTSSPAITLRYEDVVSSPAESIQRLANFLGLNDFRRVAAATKVVGKDQQQARLRRQKLLERIRFRLGAWRSALLRPFGRN